MSDVDVAVCAENDTLFGQNEKAVAVDVDDDVVAVGAVVESDQLETVSLTLCSDGVSVPVAAPVQTPNPILHVECVDSLLSSCLVSNEKFDPDGVDSQSHGETVYKCAASVPVPVAVPIVHSLENASGTSLAASADHATPNALLKLENGTRKSMPIEESEFVAPDDELRERIMKQVEFYFSDVNILKDAFLLKHVRRNKQGFVSLKLITSFRKVKSLTKDYRAVAESLKSSRKLEVNEEGTKVRRTDPLPDYDETTPSRTVVAVNLPFSNPSVENIAELFSQAGDIALVRILRPGKALPQDVKKHLTKHPELGTTMCAVIEFEQHQSAKNACETMTNGDDWRKGLHVVLLAPSKKERTAAAVEAKTEQLSRPEAEAALSARRGSGDSQPVVYHPDDIRADDETAVLIAASKEADGKMRRRRGARRKQGSRLDELVDIVSDVVNYSSGSDAEVDRPVGGGGGSDAPSNAGVACRNSLSPWREPLTPSSTPGSSPGSSPRSSPRGSPNMRRRSHGKSPLVAASPHGSPRASPDLWRRRDADSTPGSGSSSPWIQRRMRTQQTTRVSPSSSPGLARRAVGCVRQPRGPDGSGGFNGNSAGRGKTQVSHYISSVSVPARLGKGQGAKEIGHNLARERAKFGHNLVRKRYKIFYA